MYIITIAFIIAVCFLGLSVLLMLIALFNHLILNKKFTIEYGFAPSGIYFTFTGKLLIFSACCMIAFLIIGFFSFLASDIIKLTMML